MPLCPKHQPILDRLAAEGDIPEEDWDEVGVECPACDEALRAHLGMTEVEFEAWGFRLNVEVCQRLAILGPWVAA